MPAIRQLAAIMFADIVGYTGIMQQDEAMALRLLQKLKTKLEEEVTKHQGRILEFRGDGALCSFSSTLECVKAALAIQLDMQTDPLVPLRIGIHTGDVIISGDTIYGDGVNIASRMESMAVPGSIFISGRVHEDIKNQKDIQTVSLGKFILKNVTEKVELFAISNPGIKIPDTSKLEGKGEKVPQKSILVLPCVNVGNDPGQEYFSDGLTEELISNLSRLKDMRVFSRTTSMKYKGTTKDIQTIGKETGATYVMEGSVRTQGNKLRITAQMVDAIKDKQLWSDTYSGTLDDIFDIQEKVASKIANALRLKLTSDEKDSFQKRYTGNPEAFQLYLQGRFFWNKRNETGLNAAIRFFELAIQKDPGYALAWAGLADTYNLFGEYTIMSRRQLHPLAKNAISKALELDSQLAEAHISLALLLMLNEWDWVNSEKEFLIGLDLNPNYATGHHWYAEWLLFQGKKEEGLEQVKLAVELDPVSQAILKDYGIHLYYNRQYDQAIEKANQTLELDQGFSSAHRLLSLCYQGKGMWDDAIRENKIWGDLINNRIKNDLALAQIYAAAGYPDEARRLISEVSVQFAWGNNDYRSMALVYASLGEKDTAFEWLEKSYERHEESLCSLFIDPKMDPIRSDPRFDEMLKKVGIEPNHIHFGQ